MQEKHGRVVVGKTPVEGGFSCTDVREDGEPVLKKSSNMRTLEDLKAADFSSFKINEPIHHPAEQ
ncbi:MAG: hypothetical protein E6R03_08885 [Hyphomicrobiaceae bacterium]|nr:MAG: hypothetical protein E6R03_08885 [Hyphomicrobiaceae bacterium]